MAGSWGLLLPWRKKGDPYPESPPEGATFAQMLHEGVPKVLEEAGRDGGFQPEPPRRRKQDKGPFGWIPRWALAIGASASLMLGGAWINAVIQSQTQAQQRIDQALNDAPGKYTSRLGERLAAVESTIRGNEQQMQELRAMIDSARKQREADQRETEALLRQLITQTVTLTAEVRKGR